MVDFKTLASQSQEERELFKQQETEKRFREEHELQEFFKDARNSPRLSKWEIDFLASLAAQSNRLMGPKTVGEFSDRQQTVIRRIQKLIYKVG